MFVTVSGTVKPPATGPSVTDTVATNPFAIRFVFMPEARQVKDPEADMQDADFPAADSAWPFETLMAVILAGSYAIDHCSAAGELPAAALSCRLRETALPGKAEPELRARELVCAAAVPERRRAIAGSRFLCEQRI